MHLRKKFACHNSGVEKIIDGLYLHAEGNSTCADAACAPNDKGNYTLEDGTLFCFLHGMANLCQNA